MIIRETNNSNIIDLGYGIKLEPIDIDVDFEGWYGYCI